MASLDVIKSRKKSVEATQKITSAMELVATAKLKRARERFERVNAYSNLVFARVNELLASVDVSNNPYLEERDGNTLFVIVTSDLGLCGGYNNNALKLLRENMKQGDKTILVGNKAINSFRAKSNTPYTEYGNLGGTVEYDIVGNIVKDIQMAYSEEGSTITSVKLIYTKFINNVTFEATMEQLLPASMPEGQEVEVKDFEFEPSAEKVFEGVIPLYLGAVIYGRAAESSLSEQASRRTAMENANDNATEIIEELDIQYNRIRQANITQEISEIIAGAEAI